MTSSDRGGGHTRLQEVHTHDPEADTDGATGGPGPDESANRREARLQSALGGTLQQLDQGMDHLLGIRAEVGSRLSLIDGAESARDALKVELAGSLADLRDLDYAEALTRMNQQLVGLQAAQQSYIKIAGLSLFNYL